MQDIDWYIDQYLLSTDDSVHKFPVDPSSAGPAEIFAAKCTAVRFFVGERASDEVDAEITAETPSFYPMPPFVWSTPQREEVIVECRLGSEV